MVLCTGLFKFFSRPGYSCRQASTGPPPYSTAISFYFLAVFFSHNSSLTVLKFILKVKNEVGVSAW